MPSKQKPKAFNATGAARIQAAEGEGESKKLPTFAGNAYTGAPMRPEGYLTPIICDLKGFKIPSQTQPALRQHDHEKIVGHTTSITVTDKGVEIEGVFSGEDQHVTTVTYPGKNGFPWQLSIGANPTRTSFLEAGEEAEVNGRTVTGPIVIAHETELGEISFVPLGADGDTSATVTASKRKGTAMNFRAALKQINAGKYSDADVDAMTDDEAKAALKECMHDEPDGDEAKAKAKAADDENKKTDDEGKKTEANAAARIKANRKAEADETRRVGAIRAAIRREGVSQVKYEGKTFGVNEFEAHAIEAGMDTRDVELAVVRSNRAADSVGSPTFYFKSQPELSDAVLEAAAFQAMGNMQLGDDDFYKSSTDTPTQRRCPPMLAKRFKAEFNSRYTDKVQQTAHTMFKGRLGLHQMLATIARSAGYDGDNDITDAEKWGRVSHFLAESSKRITADASSTLNVSNVVANVQNKNILQGYLFTETAYLEIAQIVPVKDFKAIKNIALFGDTKFKPLGTSGEIQHATLSDQAFANQASIAARMLTIPLQTIVNDDMGAFGQVPFILGQGWGLYVNDLFWTQFMNPGLDEGGTTNFYAATHTITGQSGNSNYSSGAGSALGSAGLNAATVLFDNQVSPSGNPLGMDAEVLLYPPDLDQTAIELMKSDLIVMGGLASTSAASKQPSSNTWKGRYRPVKSRYLNKSAYTGNSTAAWYLCLGPTVMPAFQIAAWNGNMVPTVQTAGQDFQFNMLGITMRGFGGVGVTKQNFRAIVKNAGS